MKKLFHYCGIFCFLYLGAVFFEIMTRRYFEIDGKMVDFSLYVWSGIALLWGAALWRAYQGKMFLLQFTAFFSLTCMAFVLCQYYLMTGNEMYGKSLRWLLAFEAVGVLSFIFLRRKDLAFLSFSSFLFAFFSPFLIFPKIFPLFYIWVSAGCVIAIWGVSSVIRSEKIRYWVSAGGVLLFVVEIFIAGCVVYWRLPGIRFYEPKVSAPSDVKVSVIIPVYNGAQTIERCLDSLRRQSLHDIEIIVVDDGSTDNTLDILTKYAAHDARIKIVHQENSYIGTARNNGVKLARGKYVGFVDSDDWVSEDFYEKLYQTAEKLNQNVVIASKVNIVRQSNMFCLPDDLGKKVYSEEKLQQPFRDVRDSFIRYVWNKIYRRDFLQRNNILFTSHRTIYEDGYFSVLLSLYLDKIALSEAGIYYYSKGERVTVSTVDEHISNKDEALDMYEDLGDIVENAMVNEDVRQDVQKYMEEMRSKDLQNFYNLLKEEDREAFVWACVKVYGEDMCHFIKRENWGALFE